MPTAIYTIRGALILAVILAILPKTASAFPDTAKFTFAVTNGAGEQALTPNGRYLGLISTSENSVSIVDTSIFEVVALFTLSATATGIAAAEDSSAFFVATSAEDVVFRIELSGAPADLTADALESLDVTSSFIDVVATSNRLFLLNDSGNTIHVVDPVSGASDTTVSTLSINIEANELAAVNDDRLLALGSDGRMMQINTSTLSILGGTLDLGNLSSASTTAFVGVSGGNNTDGTRIAFTANRVSTGEVFGLILNDTSISLVALDADPGTSGNNPITVGDSPVSLLYTDVINPSDSDLTMDNYLYVANQQDNTLDIIAIEEYFDSDSETVAAFTTLDLSGSPTQGGISGNATDDGYIYVSLGSGNLVEVITENPNVTITAAAPTSVSSGDFSFGFTSDTAGDFQVRLNSITDNTAITTSSGSLLASGTVSADSEVTVELDSDDLQTGDNLIHIFVTSDSLVGRNGFSITANLPPQTPENFSLDFGDQQIFVKFDSVENADFYNISFGNAQNDLTGAGTLSSPVTVDDPGEAGQSITEVLSPLPNGQQVFVQVVAINDNGDEGEPTEILFETPEETVGLLSLLNEAGGCGRILWHPTAGVLPIAACLLTLLSLLFIRRRLVSRTKKYLRHLLPLLVLLSFFGHHTPAYGSESITAAEKEMQYENRDFEPLGPILFAFKVFWLFPENDAVERFYGGFGNEIYSLRLSVPITIPSGYLEPSAEVGLLIEDSNLRGADSDRVSGEESDLQLIPLRFGLTYLFVPNDRWIIAPLADVAYGLTFFDIEEEGVQVDGAKHSLSLRGGFRILIERVTRNAEDWRDFFGLESAFFTLAAGYEIPLSSSGLKLNGFTFGPEIGVVF